MSNTAVAHDWVHRLDSTGTMLGVTSLSVRRRVSRVIGERATAWGIQVGARMATYILDSLTDWPGSRSEEERQTLRRATEATTLDTLAALVSGEPSHLFASFEPIENVGSYVRSQIPLPEVVRNMHAGQEFLIQELMEAIAQLVPESERVAAISRMTRDVTSAWSSFIGRIGEEYHRQQDAWLGDADEQRARLARRLVQLGQGDVAESSQALGYDLELPHVGCVLWFDGVDLDAVRLFDFPAIAREISTATESTDHLLAGNGITLELWLGDPRVPVGEVLASERWPAALRAAVGTPQPGIRGFAATHAEATAAARVARHSPSASRRVIAYPEVELLSLLTCDFDRARSFVRRTLGPIAGTDARSAELRETLAAWIDCRGSVAAASQALYMHRNTVSYRLRQLEELLGGDWDQTRIRCALTIVEWMPGVLIEDE